MSAPPSRPEGLMDIHPPFVADRQPAVAGQRPLHDPAVPGQALAGVDVTPGDPDLDVPAAQEPPAAVDAVGVAAAVEQCPVEAIPDPTACQSRRRHHQVTPEPQPIMTGRCSHGMPVKQAQSDTRGRSPLGLGSSGSSSGATIAHSSMETRGLLMPMVCHSSTPC